MTFLGSSDHFSSSSKWFCYLQNDKMYTLGPTEIPGVRNSPRMAKNGPQNPTGPIWAYFGLFFGPRPEIFPSPFWAKIGQNRFFQKNLHYFDSRRVRDPQKPKIDPVDPPVDPNLAQFVGKRPILGSKNAVF